MTQLPDNCPVNSQLSGLWKLQNHSPCKTHLANRVGFSLWSILIFEQSGFGCSWWLTGQGCGWLPVWDILPLIPSEREGINPESRLHLFKSSATVPRKLLHYCGFYDSPCPSQSSKAFINICSNLETNVKVPLTVWQESISFILHHDSVLFYAWSSTEHCCHMLLKLWLK